MEEARKAFEKAFIKEYGLKNDETIAEQLAKDSKTGEYLRYLAERGWDAWQVACEWQTDNILLEIQKEIDSLKTIGFTPALGTLKRLAENIKAIRNQERE